MRIFTTALAGLALLGCDIIAENEKPQQNGETEEDFSLYCEGNPENNLISEDQDCDGVLSQDDCDDLDSASTIVANDQDCDEVNTAYDCDDNDRNLGAIAQDQDCDGILTVDDCDDNDPSSTSILRDKDCDGILWNQDCDDFDPTSTTRPEDRDCDGVLTADDCDDENSKAAYLDNDQDCDGVSTIEDCNDNDRNLGAIAQDQDCDGALTANDCDDFDATYTGFIGDCDGDGFPPSIDCDDLDPSIQTANTGNYYFTDGSGDSSERWTYNSNNILIEYQEYHSFRYGSSGKTVNFDVNDGSLLSYVSQTYSDGDYDYRNYQYDEDGNMLSSESIRNWSMYDAHTFTDFIYDANGNLTYVDCDSENQDMDFSYTISFTYDENDLLSSSEWTYFDMEASLENLTYHPNGAVATYQYQNLYWDPPETDTCSFDSDGNILSHTSNYGNQNYNCAGRGADRYPEDTFGYPNINFGTGMEHNYVGASCP